MSNLEEEEKSVEIITSEFANGKGSDTEEKSEKKKLHRTRSCSERSDSGISDCSNHAVNSGSCSCTSTPLLGKRYSISEEPEYRKIVDDSDIHNNNNNTDIKINVSEEESKRCFGDKAKRFSDDQSAGKCFDDDDFIVRNHKYSLARASR